MPASFAYILCSSNFPFFFPLSIPSYFTSFFPFFLPSYLFFPILFPSNLCSYLLSLFILLSVISYFSSPYLLAIYLRNDLLRETSQKGSNLRVRTVHFDVRAAPSTEGQVKTSFIQYLKNILAWWIFQGPSIRPRSWKLRIVMTSINFSILLPLF